MKGKVKSEYEKRVLNDQRKTAVVCENQTSKEKEKRKLGERGKKKEYSYYEEEKKMVRHAKCSQLTSRKREGRNRKEEIRAEEKGGNEIRDMKGQTRRQERKAENYANEGKHE